MATKSRRSSGSQINARGVTQGNTLVDPITGLPLDVLVDGNGVKRLAVDASLSIANANVSVKLDATTDSVRVTDPTTGANLKVNTNGSLDVNTAISAAGGDNIALSDGNGLITSTTLAAKRALDVNVIGANNAEFKPLPAGVTETIYGSQTVVGNGTQTIVSYTIPSTGTVYLQKCYVSGDSVGKFTIYKNNTIILVVRLSQTTFYQAIDFATTTAFGLSTNAGDVVRIDVQNASSTSVVFDSTLQTMHA